MKTYKKSCPKVIDQLNSQSARVAKKLGLDNRIEKLAEKEAFITLKDHKPGFHDHPTCRLINPSKSEIGIISKRILDEINTTIIQKTQINQWKNTTSVRHARSYSNVMKKCNLCLWEKYYIICRPDLATLNNRNELVTSCRHAKKFLLNSVII